MQGYRAAGPGVCGRSVLTLPCLVQPLPSQPAWHQCWWQSGVISSAQPCQLSTQPFSSQMFYMK